MEKAIFRTDILVGAIKATLPFASTDTTRTHLNRLCVERKEGKATFVAMDGHTLCSVTVDVDAESTIKNNGTRYALTREECEVILARAKSKPPVLEIELKDEKETKLGEFPPYERVIPDYSKAEKSALCVGFNASYLARVKTVVKAIGDRRTRACTVAFGESPLDAARIDIDGDTGKAIVVIMPMRI